MHSHTYTIDSHIMICFNFISKTCCDLWCCLYRNTHILWYCKMFMSQIYKLSYILLINYWWSSSSYVKTRKFFSLKFSLCRIHFKLFFESIEIHIMCISIVILFWIYHCIFTKITYAFAKWYMCIQSYFVYSISNMLYEFIFMCISNSVWLCS